MKLTSTAAATLLALALIVVSSPKARADDIVYTFDNYANQNGATLTGTVTTDGATGLISSSDVLSFDVTITPSSGPSVEYSVANSDSLRTSNLQADATNLFLTPSIFTYFTIYDPSFLDLDYEDYYSDPLADDSYSAYPRSSNTPIFTTPPGGGSGSIDDDPMIIASVVPEPSTFILAACGALGVMAGLRRRR